MTIDDRLNDVLSRLLKVPVESVHPQMTIENVSSWDSITHLELIDELEREFGIKFKPNEVINLIDYHTIRDVIQKHVQP
jgi:acyl carrier protein